MCSRLLCLIDKPGRGRSRRHAAGYPGACKDVDDQHPEKELLAPISGYDVPETGGGPQKRQRTGLESSCARAAGQARRGAPRRRAPSATPQTNHRKPTIARATGNSRARGVHARWRQTKHPRAHKRVWRSHKASDEPTAPTNEPGNFDELRGRRRPQTDPGGVVAALRLNRRRRGRAPTPGRMRRSPSVTCIAASPGSDARRCAPWPRCTPDGTRSVRSSGLRR